MTKDITVFASSSDPHTVTFSVNNVKAFTLATQLPDMVQTRSEVQTVRGYNFRAFESLCWRSGITVADHRY